MGRGTSQLSLRGRAGPRGTLRDTSPEVELKMHIDCILIFADLNPALEKKSPCIFHRILSIAFSVAMQVRERGWVLAASLVRLDDDGVRGGDGTPPGGRGDGRVGG